MIHINNKNHLILWFSFFFNIQGNHDHEPIAVPQDVPLQHLLKAGADVFAKTKADNTPLDYAEMYGLDKCVDIIKEHRSRQYFMCLLMGHLQSDCKLSRIPKEILIRIAKFSV